MTEAGRPFEGAGVTAISACGHWWSYPWRRGVDMGHDVVALHAASVCPFCRTAADARASTDARLVGGRLN